MSGDDSAILLDTVLDRAKRKLEEEFGKQGYRELKVATLKKAEQLKRRNARRSANARRRTEDENDQEDEE
ncbi:hypothetical protein NGB36_24065 [Streptomyces sp. RB6PN25]|uniref:Uncharacterized protein n=1 Tax=Streptomyces humicola TaxID=2953240 RepID=A0ABT1Q128_9ACTN|nr:hypothetical protein [Streptomyces humicola]MCQ4083589.1 hypothetical protein [Streptomyces humicola]